MNALFPQRKPEKHRVLKQVFFLIAITAISYILFSGLGIRLSAYFFNVDMVSLVSEDYSNASPEVIRALKFIQVFVTIGTFLTPALLFPYYLSKNPFHYVKIDRNISWIVVFQVIGLLAVMYPFIEWLLEINNRLSLPAYFSSFEANLRSQETRYEVIQDTFMKMNNIRGLSTNILVLALFPAFLEEMFFRGMFQTYMQGILKNHHWAIFSSALFFSMVHFRFFGILPIFVLGMVLGYLFYWTSSLWASVFAHFLNNASAVVLVFLSQNGYINFQIDKPMQNSTMVIVGSFALAAIFFLVLATYYAKRRDKTKDWVKIFTGKNLAQAEIIKGKLENSDIPTVILNKRDLTYHAFGPVELFVNPDDEIEALEIINKVENPQEEEEPNE